MEIYLDNAATTKPLVKETLRAHIEDLWYNPSSAYAPAEKVFLDIKRTKELLAEITGMDGSCIFTSGGTEANNTVIMSAFRKKAHYITSSIEHPSVYNTFKHLETLGAQVDYIKPRGFCVRAEDVASMVRDDTALVSVMHVNNETGALNDINAIAEAVKIMNPDTLFHSDGVQALYKTDIDLSRSVDYYTVSAHKIHALKGTGALLIREGKPLRQFHYGGEQEFSLRPGTENTLGIQAFGEALLRGRERYNEAYDKVTELHDALIGMLKEIDGAELNVPENKTPYIVSVSFPGTRAEVIVRLLGEKGIYIGTGAACSRGKLSRVMLECGVNRANAEGTVRISMCSSTTRDDIEICAKELKKAAEDLRRFSRR